MILSFIKKFGSATRKEIDNLLMDKLSETLDEKQKKNKINYIIYEMSRKDKSIKNIASSKNSEWVINKISTK